LRILVVSDTHRDRAALRQAVLSQPKAEAVIHLGDGAEEAEEMKRDFPEKMFLLVRGNCDWGSTLPTEGLAAFAGKNIFYTHGYTYRVKLGLYDAVSAARRKKADVLLFGHTHSALTEYRDGLYVMNPGSLNGSRGTYGTLDITPAGIVTNIVRISAY
jgi:putative phosphoesterase